MAALMSGEENVNLMVASLGSRKKRMDILHDCMPAWEILSRVIPVVTIITPIIEDPNVIIPRIILQGVINGIH